MTTLSALAIEYAALNPAFSPDVLTYSVQLPAEQDEYSSSNYEITAVPSYEGATVEYSSVSEPDYTVRYVSLDDHNYIEVRTSKEAVGLLQIKVTSGKKSNTYSVIIFVKP